MFVDGEESGSDLLWIIVIEEHGVDIMSILTHEDEIADEFRSLFDLYHIADVVGPGTTLVSELDALGVCGELESFGRESAIEEVSACEEDEQNDTCPVACGDREDDYDDNDECHHGVSE